MNRSAKALSRDRFCAAVAWGILGEVGCRLARRKPGLWHRDILQLKRAIVQRKARLRD
ncbi:MAG: hypothetical protein R3F11_28240 [Verrucomicrobiales bacterium]